MMDSTPNVDGQSMEVKKLQDLVEKLEEQNKILRQKADHHVPTSTRTVLDDGLMLQEESHTHPSENGSSIAGNEAIPTKIRSKTPRKNSRSIGDSDSELQSDAGNEDSWLYTSPMKAPTPDQKSVSPYDWIRQDFEKPSGSMDSARVALLAKLDEVSRANRNSQILLKPQPIPEVDVVQPEEDEPPDSPSRHPPEGRTSQEEKLFKKLEDVTDVQILARMQEESLRRALQSVSSNSTSPSTTPRITPRGYPAVSPNSPERSASSRTSSLGSSEGGGDDIPVVSGVMRRRPRVSPNSERTVVDCGYDEGIPVVTGIKRRGKPTPNQGFSDGGDGDMASGVRRRVYTPTPNQGPSNGTTADDDVPVVSGVRRRGNNPTGVAEATVSGEDVPVVGGFRRRGTTPPLSNGTVTDGYDQVPVVSGVLRRGQPPALSDGAVADGDDLVPVVSGVRRRGTTPPPSNGAVTKGDDQVPVVSGVRRRGTTPPPSNGAVTEGDDQVPVVSGVRRRGTTPPPSNGAVTEGDDQVPVVSGVRRSGTTPPPSNGTLTDGDDQVPVVSGVRRRGQPPIPQGSPERVLDGRNDEEEIPVVLGVVRRRPSLEKVKKEDFRRHSYGARHSMGSTGMSNGDHSLQASDLQRLVLVPQPAEEPVKSIQTGRVHGAKYAGNEPPPPPPPTPCTEAEPGVKQPSANKHMTPNKGSSLRQPSPVTTGRIPTPKRGIPVRQAPTPRTGLPRPRSAATPKSQLPTPGSRSAIPARRPSPQLKTDGWQDGCY